MESFFSEIRSYGEPDRGGRRSGTPEIDKEVDENMDLQTILMNMAESQKEESLLRKELEKCTAYQNRLLAAGIVILKNRNRELEQAKKSGKIVNINTVNISQYKEVG